MFKAMIFVILTRGLPFCFLNPWRWRISQDNDDVRDSYFRYCVQRRRVEGLNVSGEFSVAAGWANSPDYRIYYWNNKPTRQTQ